MKTITKINLLLIGIFFAGITTANGWNKGSEFNLKMFDNSGFTVNFDNNYFNCPNNTFSLANVKPGNHYLKVTKVFNLYKPGCGGMISSSRVVYSGWIHIPAFSQVYSVIGKHNNYKEVNVISLKPAYPHKHYNCSTINGNCETEVYGNNYDDNVYGEYNNSNCNAPKAPAFLVMGDNEFRALEYTIANTAFESNRLMIAKQAITNNYLTSAQVADLMRLMSYESSKLELAKSAYLYTIDKQNYFLVNKAFNFGSSVYALNKYINSIG